LTAKLGVERTAVVAGNSVAETPGSQHNLIYGDAQPECPKPLGLMIIAARARIIERDMGLTMKSPRW
jgi:hypothetical protein